MASSSRSAPPVSGKAQNASDVRVVVRLRGGHEYELVLPLDSGLLHDLAAAASLPDRAKMMFELPLDGGRTAATFRCDEIASVETTPPFRPASFDERSIANFSGPGVQFSEVEPISQKKGYPAIRKRAQQYLDAFSQRLGERRAKLQETCRRMGCTTFVVSAFNAGFVPLFRNWVASCERHGIDVRERTILFPTDDDAERVARELGFETCYDPESYAQQPREAVRGYGDSNFARCVFLKLAMAQDMLELGYDFLLQDMDLVWFADPIPELESRAIAERLDFQFMRDMNPRFQPLYYNSGFIFVRNNPCSRHTWQTIFKAYPAVSFFRSDQTVVNQVVSCFRERGLRTARLPDRYVDGEILAHVSVGRRSLPPDRLVAHVNWTGNLAQKLERLEKLGLWYLD